jgi:predicted TIM-barrel fold metal-dependent hydrolase
MLARAATRTEAGASGDMAGGEAPEAIIEPELPIIDAHHHLWFLSKASLDQMQAMDSPFDHALASVYREHARYLLDEFLADAGSGHNVRASVYVEADSMYRQGGAPGMRSVGEIEFANGVAAMAASGTFGSVRACAAIVGSGAELSLGDAAEGVLRASIQAGGGRYRGVRSRLAYDRDQRVLGTDVAYERVDGKFVAGLKCLQRLGLLFEVWVLEPQLPQVLSLARAFPDTQIIVNHLGTPLGVGRYADTRDERFPLWRDNIRSLAACSNVAMKLGGLGLPICGFPSFMAQPRFSSLRLATEWKPYVETAIDAFGTGRCMFASDFPVDSGTCSYRVLWNAFKLLAAGASPAEKTALFSGTASRLYKIDS